MTDIESELRVEEPQTRPVRSVWRRILSVVWKLAVLAIVIPPLQVIALKWINPPFSTMMIYQSIVHLFTGEGIGFHHTNLSWSEIPDSFVQAVVAGEDQRFFSHNGF